MVLDLKQVDLKHVRDDVADKVGRAAKDIGGDVADRVGRAAKELTSTAQIPVRKQLPKRRGPSPWAVTAGALLGALAVYLFDPQRGKSRRALLVQWTSARVREGVRSLNQLGRYSSSTAAALPQRMISLNSAQRRPTPDDLTLRDRVESEVFRDPEMPKGEILKSLGFRTYLREDELQFVPSSNAQWRVRLRTDGYPQRAGRRFNASVCFNRD